MKRVITAGAVLLALLAAGCSDSAGTPSSGGSGDSDTIFFGQLGGLTGAYAAVGITSENGARMAVDEINANGGILGKQVTIESADDRADATLATQLFNKYVSQGAVAMLGSPDNGPTTATLAEQLQVPTIGVVNGGGLTIYPEGAGKPPAPYAFSTSTNAFAWADIFAADALEKCSGLAVLHDTTAYGMSAISAIQFAYEKAGKQLALDEPITEAWGSGATVTLKAEIDKIQKSGADCAVIWLTPQDMASFMQEAESLGATFKRLYGNDTANSDDTFKDLAGAQGNGLISADITARLTPSEKTLKFREDYKARFGSEACPFAEANYDSVYMLKQAIEAGNSTDPKSIKEQLEKITDYDGFQGKLTFTPEIHSVINAEQLTLVQFNGSTLTWDVIK
jgi:branched-chain amino acid transport system substrate-binding protein